MGPRTFSLAQRFRRIPRHTLLFVVFALACPALLLSDPSPGTARPEIREELRVHRVQVDVSVIDPQKNDHASVPDLPRDAFRLRIDGQPLQDEVEALVEFDQICPRIEEGPAEPSLPVMIVLADLNFLDLGMRHAAASAIEDLAEFASSNPLRAKILAFDRRVIELSGGFTDDPAELRAAARRLRELLAPAPPSDDGTNIARGRRDLSPEAESLERGRPGEDSEGELALLEGDRPLAFELSSRGLVLSEEEPIEVSMTPSYMLATREIDPRPSLSAIESTLLAHGGMRGRKALVLFSSTRFDLPDELWLDYLDGARLAAQEGFALWTVDASGIGDASSSNRSEMLDYLAYSTGGEALTRGARPSIAFERAWDQQSCYYLFSIPFEVDGTRGERHLIDVSLDTDRYPELWPLRVRSVETVEILDRVAQTRRERLAALMAPDTHSYPEVRINATYPEGDQSVSLVSVSTVLSDLFFMEREDSRFEARFALEGVVADRFGSPVCRLGDGRERMVIVSSPPARHPPSLVTVETTCGLRGWGDFEIRAVVEDLEGGDLGAARLGMRIENPRRVEEGVSSLRLGRNSGRDFLIGARVDERATIPRDRARRAFVPVAEGDRLVGEDRLLIRFVVCGDMDPPWAIGYSIPGSLERAADHAPSASFRVALSPLSRHEGEDSCREYEGVIPEGSLAPGRYGIALLPRAEETQSREDLDRHLREGEMLDSLEFTIRGPIEQEPGTEEDAGSEIAQIGVFGEWIALKSLVGQTN